MKKQWCMLAKRSVELRGGREFMVEEVGVKFSSKDAQQSKEGMKVKAWKLWARRHLRGALSVWHPGGSLRGLLLRHPSWSRPAPQVPPGVPGRKRRALSAGHNPGLTVLFLLIPWDRLHPLANLNILFKHGSFLYRLEWNILLNGK